MKSILTIITSIVTFLVPMLVALAVSVPAHANGDDYCPTGSGPTQPTATTISRKNTVEPQKVFFWIVTIGTTIGCAYQRFVENDPCIGDAKPVKTSASDDTITPGNLSDKKDEGAIYIFKGR